MTKAELVERIILAAAKTRRVNRYDVESVLHALASVVTAALVEGDTVPLPGVGRLEARKRCSRTGRNPRTGEAIIIPACRVPLLRPSVDLKIALKATVTGGKA